MILFNNKIPQLYTYYIANIVCEFNIRKSSSRRNSQNGHDGWRGQREAYQLRVNHSRYMRETDFKFGMKKSTSMRELTPKVRH